MQVFLEFEDTDGAVHLAPISSILRINKAPNGLTSVTFRDGEYILIGAQLEALRQKIREANVPLIEWN